MKLNALKIDSAKAEAGTWVAVPEFGDLELKVRGINNADYRRRMAELIRAVPRHQRPGGRLAIEQSDAINATLLLETVLMDWRRLEGDDGAPIPYSAERARDLLTNPDYLPFRQAVVEAASRLAEDVADEVEDDAKN